MGHSEHNTEVTGGREYSLAGRQPTLARLGLALGTVPISARVVRDGLMSTAQAGIPVATQCCGATTLNGTKRFELLEVKAGSIAVQEVIALRAYPIYRSSYAYWGPTLCLRVVGHAETIRRLGSLFARPEQGYRLQRERPAPKERKTDQEYDEAQRHIRMGVVIQHAPLRS